MNSLTEKLKTQLVENRVHKILAALHSQGGAARWETLITDLKQRGITRRTAWKGLKELVEAGIVEKYRRTIKGHKAVFYAIRSNREPQVFCRMNEDLLEVAKRLYAATQQPDLSVTDRGKRLIEGVHELLGYHQALTLTAIKLALSAPSEEKAAHRFRVLMDRFSIYGAANAMWLCWLNRDIAADVLEAIHAGAA